MNLPVTWLEDPLHDPGILDTGTLDTGILDTGTLAI
jgi:hypothetical protein